VAGGYISLKAGSGKVAFFAMLLSAACCIFFIALLGAPSILFLSFMVTWGITVIADSPQFSTLVAQTAPLENRGTALTIVTCIGFAITIVSIQLLSLLFQRDPSGLVFATLAFGPAIGLRLLWPLVKRKV
jgi:MFS family permease